MADNVCVADHLALAHWTAQRYYPARILETEEASQEAMLAIVQAGHKYDPTRARFTTFAVVSIRYWLSKVAARVRRQESRLSDGFDVETAVDTADRLHVVDDGEQVEKLLGKLPGRWRRIVRQRFGLGVPERTIAEIAEAEGCSPSRIGQMLIRALRRMRDG